MADRLAFTVNGKTAEVATEGQRPLLDVLREDLHLTGTKYGCGEGKCGACSVMMDGKRVFSCLTAAEDAAGKKITTIEGLMGEGERLHPLQEAFLEEGAFQCGYCTAGMIVAAAALLQNKPRATREEIVSGMNGNVCRCCAYPKIVEAIERVAAGSGGGR